MVAAVSAQKFNTRPFPLHDDYAFAGSCDLQTASTAIARGRRDHGHGYCITDQSLSELFRHYPVLFHETAK